VCRNRSRRPLRIALVACERRCTNNGGRYQPGRWPPASEHPCASGPPASQDRREQSRQTADRLDDETGLTLTDWTHSNASARCPTPLNTSGRRFDPCRATTVIAGQLRFAGLTTGTADPRWAKNCVFPSCLRRSRAGLSHEALHFLRFRQAPLAPDFKCRYPYLPVRVVSTGMV